MQWVAEHLLGLIQKHRVINGKGLAQEWHEHDRGQEEACERPANKATTRSLEDGRT
jgi:hypothetical protein